MRACFLGQSVTTLGFGVAMLQTPHLPEPEPPENPAREASDDAPAPAASAVTKPSESPGTA